MLVLLRNKVLGAPRLRFVGIDSKATIKKIKLRVVLKSTQMVGIGTQVATGAAAHLLPAYSEKRPRESSKFPQLCATPKNAVPPVERKRQETQAGTDKDTHRKKTTERERGGAGLTPA